MGFCEDMSAHALQQKEYLFCYLTAKYALKFKLCEALHSDCDI